MQVLRALLECGNKPARVMPYDSDATSAQSSETKTPDPFLFAMISDPEHLEGFRGRYALPGEIEIAGTERGLASFAESLRSFKGKTILPLPVLSLGDVKPYDSYITAIELQLSEGKVKVLREGNVLLITGTPEHMAVFADDVSFLVEQVSGEGSEEVSSHSHIEFYEGHLWLDPDSQPIVITCSESER